MTPTTLPLTRLAALLGLLATVLLPIGARAAYAQEAPPPAAVAEADPQALPDPQAFPDTGFRVADAVWPSYLALGGADTFGAPISRAFTLRGATVQLFQRALLQLQPDGSAQPVSLTSADWLPVTRLNGLTLPAADPVLATVTPKPDQPSYPARLREFTRSVVPDTFGNLPVGFQAALFGTGNALQVWGAPTSRPAADPGNPGFVYQRFERGVLMYNGQAGTTTWLALGDALKALLTGRSLPADLAAEAPAAGSPLLRPELLPDTSLAQAFAPDAPAAESQAGAAGQSGAAA